MNVTEETELISFWSRKYKNSKWYDFEGFTKKLKGHPTQLQLWNRHIQSNVEKSSKKNNFKDNLFFWKN